MRKALVNNNIELTLPNITNQLVLLKRKRKPNELLGREKAICKKIATEGM